jgi:flagellar secretion chaperone FliS
MSEPMSQEASGEYLKSAVMTATPEQLQLMLYDGAIRFARQAREAIAAADYETSCEKLIRAQQVVSAMEAGLRPEVNPGVCEQMASLYQFVYNRLVDANVRHDLTALDEAVRILEHQRETWKLLIEKLRQEDHASSGPSKGAPSPPTRTPPTKSPAAGSTLCVEV